MINVYSFPVSGASTLSDRELLEAIRNGNVLAFHELYARYSSVLREYIAKEARSSAGADDLVLQVFIDIWKGSVCFEGAEHPTVQSWMYSLARASCYRSAGTPAWRASGFVHGM